MTEDQKMMVVGGCILVGMACLLVFGAWLKGRVGGD